MNASLFLHGWSWNTPLLLACATLGGVLWAAFRSSARWGHFVGAIAVVVLALLSPVNALADGVLFSAHMTQHILLLLIAPALLVLSLPREFSIRGSGRLARTVPLFAWAAGVGAMWLWHLPALCDAAAINPAVRTFQTVSLVALGTLFWWPILAPSARNRLLPGLGVLYLFTACLGCTALGIILTLTPVEVCSVYRAPLSTTNAWAGVRDLLSPERDRQIGGLLMWVPMCSVYVAAIMLELGRWFAGGAEKAEAIS